MALWPNTTLDIHGWSPVSWTSSMAFLSTVVKQNQQRQLAFFANTVISATASIPEGGFGGPTCILHPITAGGMSAGSASSAISMAGVGPLLSGKTLEGSGEATFSSSSSLGMQVTIAASATATFSGTGGLAMTIGMDGDATATFSGPSALAMIVGFDGAASFTFSSSSNLKGLLALEGHVTPFSGGAVTNESIVAAIEPYLEVINTNIHKASKLIPTSTPLP